MVICTKQRRVVLVLSVFALVSITLQVYGIFDPRWMTFERTVTSKETTNLGLWSVTICEGLKVSDTNKPMCFSISHKVMVNIMESLNDTSIEVDKKLLDFVAQKVLTVSGLITTLFGLVFVFFYVRSVIKDDKGGLKPSGIISIICLVITASLVCCAIVIEIKHNAECNHMLKAVWEENFEMVTPVAIIIYGIGGAFSALLAVVVMLLMCYENKWSFRLYRVEIVYQKLLQNDVQNAQY